MPPGLEKQTAWRRAVQITPWSGSPEPLRRGRDPRHRRPLSTRPPRSSRPRRFAGEIGTASTPAVHTASRYAANLSSRRKLTPTLIASVWPGRLCPPQSPALFRLCQRRLNIPQFPPVEISPLVSGGGGGSHFGGARRSH